MDKIPFLWFFLTVFLFSALIIYGFVSLLFSKRVIEYEIWIAKKFYPKWLAEITINHVSKRWYFPMVIVRGILSMLIGLLGLYIFYLNIYK